ncbi:serine hydrolase [Nocardia sp. NPDC051030]|uniref:serine hydrolase n=1 Tax=Nocardia sp. NPDC051030 TaxID=3155162 RepID=UPI0034399CD3
MTQFQARTPRSRWLWVATGCLVALIFAALGTAPHAVATGHRQIGVAQRPSPVAPTDGNRAHGAVATTPAPPPQLSAITLAQQMQAAIQLASPGTTVGIDVVDTSTGGTLASLNSDQQFYTASVVKLLIALDELRTTGWQADSDTAEDLTEMLSTSDDEVADVLWDEGGAEAIVSRMADLIGLTDTVPPEDPAQWGETLMSPRDVVKVFEFLGTAVPEPARTLVMNALRGTTRISADGTDQYFGIPDGLSGLDWAVKQGWMALDDSITLDSTGMVGAGPGLPLHYAVVVLTAQPADTSWAAGGSALTAGISLLHTVIG